MKDYQVTFMVGLLALTGCGGGGGGGGDGSSDNVASTQFTKKGYVLDGNVASARVCFDKNADNQCTNTDGFVTTDSEGYYELQYSDSSYLDKYQLIADVRYLEASDLDYNQGKPLYDYVLKAFDSDQEQVVISPLSTYMNYRSSVTEDSEQNILESTMNIIKKHETYDYSTVEEIEYQYIQLLQSNYIKGKNDNNEHSSNFNRRLHNINEVLARKLQESQIAWEDNFNSGLLNTRSQDWSEISDLVVSNANANVFQGFEEIIRQVTSYNYSSFNASDVSSTLAISLPTKDQMNGLLDYYNGMKDISDEFNGSTYKHTHQGTYDHFDGYYVFNNDSISYYIDDGELCLYATAPTYLDANILSEDEIISHLNETFTAMNYTPLTKVTSPPINCSSVYSVLEEIQTAESPDSGNDGEVFVPFASSGHKEAISDNNFLPPMVVKENPVVQTSSLSSGNLAAGTLNSCMAKGAWNSCVGSKK